jgi:hypothetical protein
MSEKLSLREIEKKAYFSYFEDGLLDLAISLGVFSYFFFYFICETINIPDFLITPITVSSSFIMYHFYLFSKNKITIARLGHVKFGRLRQRKIWQETDYLILFLIYLLILLFPVIMIFGIFGLKKLAAIFFTYLILSAALSSLAFWKKIYRFYFYSIFLLCLGFTGLILNFSDQYYIGAFIIEGIIIFCFGIFTFRQFLKKHPKVTEELTNV